MTNKKIKTERWFTPRLVWKNFKSIEWLPLKTQKDGTEGILKKFGATVVILTISALLFAAIDAVLSLLIAYGGFNV